MLSGIIQASVGGGGSSTTHTDSHKSFTQKRRNAGRVSSLNYTFLSFLIIFLLFSPISSSRDSGDALPSTDHQLRAEEGASRFSTGVGFPVRRM